MNAWLAVSLSPPLGVIDDVQEARPMFRDPSIAGNWSMLVDRIETAGIFTRWVGREPILATISSPAELPGCVAPGVDRERVDEVLGALVRLGARDGGDDQDAVLVVLHLLSDGACALTSRLRDLSDDMLSLVVGELAAQVRAFPWQRRTRAYAANLLLDTKAALWRELRHTRAGYGGVREILVDPLDRRHVATFLDVSVPGPEDDSLRLHDVLVWAARSHLVPIDDLQLLADLAGRREHSGAPDECTQDGLARQRQISERTLRRRRDRTLATLRQSRCRYLQAVA